MRFDAHGSAAARRPRFACRVIPRRRSLAPRSWPRCSSALHSRRVFASRSASACRFSPRWFSAISSGIAARGKLVRPHGRSYVMATKSPIPEGYRTATPYLIVKGAAEAIEFYKRAFGATEMLHMADPQGRIGHAEIRIGDSVIMLADEHPA